MENSGRILRRPKTDPNSDALHTMRWGLLVFVVLLIVLPLVFR